MKRLHLQEEELSADRAQKKHKTQSNNEYLGKTILNVCYGAGIYDSETENSEAMEVEEEDELDSDVEVVEVETAEEELERLQKDWNAPIYGFFQQKPIISVVNGRRCHEFICSAPMCLGRGRNRRRVRRYLDTQDAKSTGNLHKHAVICWGEEAVKRARSASTKGVPRLLSDAKGNGTDETMNTAIGWVGADGTRKSTHPIRPNTKAEIRLEAVQWVSQSKHPFNIVQDHGFLRLMKTGRPHMWIPSPMTIAHDVHKVFASCQQQIGAILQKYPGRLSFAISTWTSPNNVPYMAVSVHLEESGKAVSLFLDFTEVTKSPNGLNLAFEFVQILKGFGIEEKLLAITCDNASNKDTIVAEVCDRIKEYHGKQARVYCLAQIINIAVKSILNQFDSRNPRKGINGAEIVDTESDNIEGWIEEPIGAEVKTKIEPVRLMLVKLRKATCFIKRSTSLLRQRWNNIVSEQGLPVGMIPCDLTTRWNSTYDMLRLATKYKPALRILLNDEDELSDYQLNDTEWKLAEELCDVLKIFKEATLYASRDTTSVAAIIPTMDRIYSLLSAQTTACRYSDLIITALSAGMTTLGRYYYEANISQVYRIATILNPRHKLRYFKQSGRDEGWIDESRAMLENQWETSYANNALSAKPTPFRAGKTPRTGLSVRKQQDEDHNMFDFDLFTSALSETANYDELKQYLSTDIEQVTNPIEWWNSKARAFPRLSRMAIDYLTIPATSVEVERIFSEGRNLLSHTRSRLTPKSTRALMCLGEWSMSGFIKESDMLRILMMEEDFKDEDGNECEYEDEDLGTLFCD